MNNIDPAQERVSSLRRSRIARRGLVVGAVAGSLGIAGALGLSAAVNPGAPANGGSTGAPASNGSTYTGGDKGAADKSQKWIFLGDDGESGEGHESDDGGQWVPVQPSPQFSSGGGNATGGSGSSNGGGQVVTPHAVSGGS
jgi:hypothetical protein